MPEENNLPKADEPKQNEDLPADGQEKQELKDLLQRGEVKTMQKDISQLRENEAQKERERISTLAASNEADFDKQKRERILKESEEQKRVEEGNRRKEEEARKRQEEERKRKEDILKKIEEERRIKAEQFKDAETKLPPMPPPPMPTPRPAPPTPPDNLPIMPEPKAPEPAETQRPEIFEKAGDKTKEQWRKEELERKAFLERVAGVKSKDVPIPPALMAKETTIIPEPPEKPSALSKIIIRGLMILAVLLLVSGAIWYFALRQPAPGGQEPPPPEGEEPPPQQEVIIPAPLIPMQATQTIEIAAKKELPSALSQIISKKAATDGFTRILVKDAKENNILGLAEFLSAFGIKSPDGFLEKLDNDFTLFYYPQKEGNRLGFIAKIKNKEGLTQQLADWEKSMATDTIGLFSALGHEGPPLVPYFRQSSFKETPFRFLTISRDDLGICYAIVDDYLIVTTSFLSMNKTMEAVENQKISKAGQLFIIGFEGKTVTPELEEIFGKYKPGGVLLLSRNIENPDQLKKLTADLQILSLRETGLPLFVAVDQEGGAISRIHFAKEKTGQSEIDDAQEAYLVSKQRGEELKELGINLDLAPVLDVVNKGDFLFSRTFSINPPESGDLAKSLILGQKETGILTAIKHFPGYGGIVMNPENNLAMVENTPEISQFKRAMEANPEFVMTSNVVYQEIDPALPFTFSPEAIQFTKNALGSDTVILSDDLAQNSLLNNFSLKEVLLKPIEAGVDVLIFSGWDAETSQAMDVFYGALKNGEVSQANIKDAVSKIIKLKRKLTI